ncbi:MAG: hypothetical protein KBT03_12715, partial [Bacteroidales bacterium]|nr:hypothetical protein [Candidatus Scybalousia scybalohippi]
MKKVLLFIVLCCFLQNIIAQETKKTHLSISSNNEIFYTLFVNEVHHIDNVGHYYDEPRSTMNTERFYNIFNWRKDLLVSLYCHNWRIFTGMGYEEKNIGIDNTEDAHNGEITSIRFHQETLTIPLGVGYYRDLGTSFLYGGNIGIEVGIPRRLKSTTYFSKCLIPSDHWAVNLVLADVPDEYYFYSIKSYFNISTFFNFEIGYKMNSFCNVYLGLNCKYLTYSYLE